MVHGSRLKEEDEIRLMTVGRWKYDIK